LTVWRTLHVEQDRMGAPGKNDGPFDGAGKHVTLIGDDDVDPMGPIPDPPLTTLTKLMRPAYVETVADLAALNKHRDWVFVHNAKIGDLAAGGPTYSEFIYPQGKRDVP